MTLILLFRIILPIYPSIFWTHIAPPLLLGNHPNTTNTMTTIRVNRIAKHKTTGVTSNRPPGVIHVLRSFPNATKHQLGCFDTPNFKLLLTEMYSLCIPPTYQEDFIRHSMRSITSIFPLPIDTSVPNIPVLTRCIIDGFRALQAQHASCLQEANLIVRDAVPKQLTQELHGCYLVDCILSRTHKKPRISNESRYYETIYQTRTSRSLCNDENDAIFRTVILISPYSACFWTTAFVADSFIPTGDVSFGIGSSITKSPMASLPTSWLRLVQKTGLPARGGFIKKINHVWSIDFLPRKASLPRVYHCLHFNDDDPDSPLLPPDQIGSNIPTKDLQAQRSLYRSLFDSSPSNKVGCRRYVSGALYQNIPPSAYIYDPSTAGNNACFQASILDGNKRPISQSNIVVCLIPQEHQLYKTLNVASRLYTSSKTFSKGGNCRQKTGDNGFMSAYGQMLHRFKRCINSISFHDSDGLLIERVRETCHLAAEFISNNFPGTLSLLKSLRTIGGLQIPDDLGGDANGCSSNIAISVDLMNSSHIDINDASVGVVLFSETELGSARNWYFVMPNVLIKIDSTTYSGLVIRLSHGVSILFDGRVIRHCTSVHKCVRSAESLTSAKRGPHTVGWFFGLSLPALTQTPGS